MPQLAWLDPDSLAFPSPATAAEDPDGLLAVGGDLRPQRLLAAYRLGIFPWYEEGGPLLWWSPDPRMVLKPADVHVSRSMRRLIRRGRYQVSMDQAFPEVIERCSALRRTGGSSLERENSLEQENSLEPESSRELEGSPEPESNRAELDSHDGSGTWITPDMIHAYCTLHQMGYAHSVEVWDNDALVGGLYGISLGRMFFGESMFSVKPDTSKLAFITLARQLQQWHFSLIDCQLPTDHLYSMGAAPIPRHQFLKALETNADLSTRRGLWTLEIQPADR